MSKQDREKWNKRYTENSYHKNNPVTLVEEWLPKLPVGRALDVACGAGRMSLLLAQAGFQVDAIDISHEGLSQAKQKAEDQGFDLGTQYTLRPKCRLPIAKSIVCRDCEFVPQIENITVQFFGGFESAIYPNAEMTASDCHLIPFCSVLVACDQSRIFIFN